MSKSVIYRIVFLVFFFAAAQRTAIAQPYLDSLIEREKVTKNDTERVVLLGNIVRSYAETNPDSSLYYSELQVDLARKMKFKVEEAASLREMNIEVTIVQRISRLMDRQLDPLGSQLLHEELTAKGVEIYYNDEIDRFMGDKSITGIRLKSGLLIEAGAIVIAIGTVPNIEVAKKRGH